LSSLFFSTCIFTPFVNVVTKISSIYSSLFVAPLYFLEFSNDKSIFISLIDGGSQLNVIDKKLLKHIIHARIPGPPSLTSFQGAQGIDSPILKWARFRVHLANGSSLSVVAAVVDSLPCSMILGQPFLISNGIHMDFANAILTTPAGPLKLRVCERAPTKAKVNSVTVNDLNIDFSESNINKKQQKKFLQFLSNYSEFLGSKKKGIAKHVKHRIRLDTDHPITDRPRHHTSDQNKHAAEEAYKMLDGIIIRPSNSPYASEVVMAKKKDSDGNFTGWRFCIDYRNINKRTIKDAYPLPRITDLLHDIKKSRYFVALDLRQGYW